MLRTPGALGRRSPRTGVSVLGRSERPARRRRRCLAELEFPRPTLYPRRCGRILCVYHGQFRIGSSRSLHSRLRLKASSLELDRPSAPAGGPTCHGRRVQREATRGSSAAEGYKIVNTQRRVEAMVEAHQDAYHRTLSAHRALSATYPHTLGLTLRVYRPAHRHQTTRGARLCERPPLPPQV